MFIESLETNFEVVFKAEILFVFVTNSSGARTSCTFSYSTRTEYLYYRAENLSAKAESYLLVFVLSLKYVQRKHVQLTKSFPL